MFDPQEEFDPGYGADRVADCLFDIRQSMESDGENWHKDQIDDIIYDHSRGLDYGPADMFKAEILERIS